MSLFAPIETTYISQEDIKLKKLLCSLKNAILKVQDRFQIPLHLNSYEQNTSRYLTKKPNCCRYWYLFWCCAPPNILKYLLLWTDRHHANSKQMIFHKYWKWHFECDTFAHAKPSQIKHKRTQRASKSKITFSFFRLSSKMWHENFHKKIEI